MNWMANITVPDIPPEMNFSDIIIPTMDLVRGSFLLETLLTNNKKVCQFMRLYREIKGTKRKMTLIVLELTRAWHSGGSSSALEILKITQTLLVHSSLLPSSKRLLCNLVLFKCRY